jgi:hypothetical protein
MPEFVRPHHHLIFKVLSELNTDFLNSCQCYFGGGTRIVLELNEYRESVDVDLLCADVAGYRQLRQTITQSSLGEICSNKLKLLREVRADMYGIRTYFEVDSRPVKFELIREGRINLTSTMIEQSPVPVLSPISCFAEKLLANADRGADKRFLSRDLIDLAFMSFHWFDEVFEAGFEQAKESYGDTVKRELNTALSLFEDKAYKKSCCTDLGIDDTKTLEKGLMKLRELA